MVERINPNNDKQQAIDADLLALPAGFIEK